MLRWCLVLVTAMSLWQVCSPKAAGESIAAELRTRRFELDYGASIVGLPAGTNVRVWIPTPTSDEAQRIDELGSGFPASTQVGVDPEYGNKMRYFSVESPSSGVLEFSQRFFVERKEVRGHDRRGNRTNVARAQLGQFLIANRRVPISGRPLELLEGIEISNEPLKLARTLYDVVDENVTYDKSKPGYGNGDSNWVCDSRTGNCTDFHSLFISLARGQGIPSRFEIGFPLPATRGSGRISGYHCWAHFFVDGLGWLPVDISEADKDPTMKEYYFGNLTENRIAFSQGRDLTLVPKQDGPPLNYFVYPYVEVEGVPWPPEKVQLKVSYKDE